MLRFALCLAAAASARADFKAPIETIDLDLPASERWLSFAKKYGDLVKPTLDYLDEMAGNGTALYPIVSELRDAVLEGGGWTSDHLAEMKSLADNVPDATEEQVQFANLFYEFGTLGVGSASSKSPIGCTSIVAETPAGAILHARNQDYSMPGLLNITVQVKFTRKGKVVYEGNTFAGYIGLPTAMVPGGWSVSCDSRFNGDGWNLADNIRAAKAGAKTIGIFVRDMCESSATYSEALHTLNVAPTIAPAYYIVAGTASGEGAVVTRNRTSPDNTGIGSNGEGVWSIGDGTKAPGTWWRLETNFDHWWPDALTDGRRAAANEAMAEIGQDDISLDAMYGLLSTPPVLAGDTVYTATMMPKDGTYETVIREH